MKCLAPRRDFDAVSATVWSFLHIHYGTIIALVASATIVGMEVKLYALRMTALMKCAPVASFSA